MYYAYKLRWFYSPSDLTFLLGVLIESSAVKSYCLPVHAGSGVTTDRLTQYAGIIMALSVLPFVIVQLPQILHSSSGRHLAVLAGLVVSVALLIAYCLYQVFRIS